MPLHGHNYSPADKPPGAKHRRRLSSWDDSSTPLDTQHGAGMKTFQTHVPDAWLQGSAGGSAKRRLKIDEADIGGGSSGLGNPKHGVGVMDGGVTTRGGAVDRSASDINSLPWEQDRSKTSDFDGDDVATGRKLAAVPEFGTERDISRWDRAQELKSYMRTNLKESGWLGSFEPMQMHCPLLGRRVEWQSVSEFAALAWRCDGLGFAWECLHAAKREL